MDSGGSALTLARMTTRNLYRRPVRTSLTAIGVAAGVVAIVAFSTIVRGLWDSVEEIIHVGGTDLLVMQANVAADLLSVLDEVETREKLLAVPGVEQAIGTLWHVVRTREAPFCLLVGLRRSGMGVDPDMLLRGRYPEKDDEVLLGWIAAKYVLERDVGATVEILDEHYQIVGVFRSNSIFIDAAMVMTLPRLQQLALKEGQVTVFQVHVREGFDIAAVSDEIERRYPEVVSIGEAAEYSKADQGLVMADSMIWAVSFIAIVIGSIIVANTMWMSVLERTREIGVLRAVGWTRQRIVVTIILEAAGVGLIAAAIGCPAGIGLAKLSATLPVAEQFLQPVVSVEPFLIALGIAVALSVLGALIPAWRAARISPAEALRYE
ncbi:MAG: ABC transporter permease [Planctomycetes bacterium]|nr:ABC transporter permease [Planctomycetota bacterium]